MHASEPDSGPFPSPADRERLLVLLGYGLFLIAPPLGGIGALIGVVIAHVRLAHAAGTPAESHYRNQIMVFWVMLAMACLMLLLFMFGLGLSLAALTWPFPLGWPLDPSPAGHALVWAMALPLLGLAAVILVGWYYWRLLRGFLRMLSDRPY